MTLCKYCGELLNETKEDKVYCSEDCKEADNILGYYKIKDKHIGGNRE